MGKTTKYVLIGLGAVVLLIVVLIATKKPDLTQVATDKAAVRDITESVSASGKIKPHIEVKISPEVSGEIVELPVKEGDVVKKGQLLCKIRPDILQSELDRAQAAYNTQKAQIGNAKALLDQSKASLDNLKAIYDRDKTLYQNKVITTAEFQLAESN